MAQTQKANYFHPATAMLAARLSLRKPSGSNCRSPYVVFRQSVGHSRHLRHLLDVVDTHDVRSVQNAGGLAERALLAADTVATTTLGVSWSAFCVFQAFTTNMVNVCPLVVGRCTGDLDDDGARAAAGRALLLAGSWGAVGVFLAGVAGKILKRQDRQRANRWRSRRTAKYFSADTARIQAKNDHRNGR